MRYSETLVKNMHGQSAGPSYTQQERQGRLGDRRDGGVKGMKVGWEAWGEGGEGQDLWFNL